MVDQCPMGSRARQRFQGLDRRARHGSSLCLFATSDGSSLARKPLSVSASLVVEHGCGGIAVLDTFEPIRRMTQNLKRSRTIQARIHRFAKIVRNQTSPRLSLVM
jgi:hypothetical protein